tara:strand:+ start:2450 stop:2911 length:462 start_codon:yes stop_codon:yes gene_type:complete
MARFTHPGLGSPTIGETSDETWTIEGGTLGLAPVYSRGSDPLFSGGYNQIGTLCHFHIDLLMLNIVSFGTGQYFVKLPFPSKNNYLLTDGCLHDESTGDEYAILGHVEAGGDILKLLTTASNGRQVPFDAGVPINLDRLDSFHIAGLYEVLGN